MKMMPFSFRVAGSFGFSLACPQPGQTASTWRRACLYTSWTNPWGTQLAPHLLLLSNAADQLHIGVVVHVLATSIMVALLGWAHAVLSDCLLVYAPTISHLMWSHKMP